LPGLDPGIHVLETEMEELKEDVDTRDTPAQDEFRCFCEPKHAQITDSPVRERESAAEFLMKTRKNQ
jgi:hypothetical protein